MGRMGWRASVRRDLGHGARGGDICHGEGARLEGPAMTTIMLELDDLDAAAVNRAIARRQLWRAMPDSDGGNVAGRVVAEICRGWMDAIDGRSALDWWESGE